MLLLICGYLWEVMPHAVAFGFEVGDVVFVDFYADGRAFGNGNPVPNESTAFGGVVAEEVEGANSKVSEDLRSGAKFSGVGRQSKC